MKRRLVLWDIDGTLIRSYGVGGRAIEEGVMAAAGLLEVPTVPMGGKTDPQIVREIFLAAEIAEDRIAELLPTALAHVEKALAAAEAELRRVGIVLPGVLELLDRLDALDGVRQTLLTGNLVANAALKVAAFDLGRYFDAEVGAYGSDDMDRAALVPIALERVARLRGETYEPDEVWVIGDTPNDLACARAGGVRCLLVGTGTGGIEAVRDAGADAAVEDLSDTESILTLLCG